MDSVADCNCIQDLHGWYHCWNCLRDSVRWVQLDTRYTWVVSSSELFDG
jgi:hypothetical protein